MGSLLSYSAITTKVKAMHSKLFSKEDYIEFANLTSIPEAVAYLKKHPAYSEIFKDVDENKLHRGEVERLIYISLCKDYESIFKFSNPEQRKFLKVYFMHYETKMLKSALRYMFSENSDLQNLYNSNILTQYSQINFEKLYASGNMEELIANLRDTEYYKPLSGLKNLAAPTLFDYELAVDLYYFSRVWKLLRKLISGNEQNHIINSYGSKIDMLNIQWIYRSKKYYHMSNGDIYSLIIPINYKLKKSDISAMVEATSLEEFEQITKETFYSKVFKEEISASNVLETIYVKILDKIHRSNASKKPYSIATLYAYLYFKEEEIDRLTNALECIRYGLSSNQTLEYVIK